MHSYHHNIKTFNSATRHLTRVERSLYRDLIELYYDTEQPFQATDFDRLSRTVLANSDEEKEALRYVLSEFFIKTGDVYTHNYCDDQIEKYRVGISAKAKAGIASAAAKKIKIASRIEHRTSNHSTELNVCSTEFNTCSTVVHNHEPITNNQINTKPTEDVRPCESEKLFNGNFPNAVGIQSFVEACDQNGIKRIPETDAVFEFAGRNGISEEMIKICWQHFVRTNRESGKRQKDWRKAFRNCVRSNWYKLWYIQPDGEVIATSQYRAMQADFEMESA